MLDAGSHAAFASGPSSRLGHLLFVRENTLVAQPYDPVRLESAGELFPVADPVRGFSVSDSGALAYSTSNADRRELLWFDREGKRLGAVGEPGPYGQVAFSPDEKRVAVTRQDQNADIWLLDPDRGTASRFTSDPAPDDYPVWSPQGDRIAFSRPNPQEQRQLLWKPTSGAGQEEVLLRLGGSSIPQDWSRDGRWIAYITFAPKTGADLWLLPVSGDRKPLSFAQTEFGEREARFSPDGRWMAYVSNDTGVYEVYVQPVPPSGARSQISNGGGRQPEWRGDGKELFYLALDRKLLAASITAGATFQAGVPRALFQTRVMPPGPDTVRSYAVSADGRRFLINSQPEDARSSPITVVLHWQAGVKP